MNRRYNPASRAALFALADPRGNNPHGTRETADAEGRRLNAQRYETVGQMDHALDKRALLLDQRARVAQLGAVPPAQQEGGLFGALLFFGLGVALATVFLKRDEDDRDIVGDDDDTLGDLGLMTRDVPRAPRAPRQHAPRALPAPTAPAVVTVVTTPAPALVTNPIVPPPIENPKRAAKKVRLKARRRAKPVVENTPVVIVETPVVVVDEKPNAENT